MKFDVKIGLALEVLEKNLKDHIAELKDAQDVWVEDVTKALKKLKDAVDREGVKASYQELQHLFFAKPVDNRPEYSKLIGAMQVAKRSGQTVVQMDEDDYDAAFNDNWQWRQQSKVANTSYSSRKKH